MATVLLPRSLLALFPTAERRYELEAPDVAGVLVALDARVAGLRERVVEDGVRIRPHIKIFVQGVPAELSTPVGQGDTIHIIPAVSGGAAGPAPRPRQPRG
jgi:molybdopterin converting factor small subunit